ncbi:MAG: hypothetical protein ABSH56_16885 [Bryobacteraceae bacterium]|jgi:hypothetical protein
MSDAEQTALAKSIVDQGVPTAKTGDVIAILAKGRSSLILPLIEQKLEEVVKSPDPRECFVDKSLDIPSTVITLWSVIAYPGNRQALLEASKLLKLDEKRFGPMVGHIVYAAMAEEREFTVANQGFDLGDPAIDKRIVPVMEDLIEKELPQIGNPLFENVPGARHKWAEALVDRYGGAPTELQWATDPLASRLKPALRDAFTYDVFRYAKEAAAKREQK